MKRICAVLSTVLVLCGALYLYCLLIVPLLEPPSQYVQRDSDPKWNTEELQFLKALFKEGSWELNESRHIAISNIHLFVKDYKIAENGEINVDRCSMVIVNNDSTLRINERYKRSLIVQCSGETTLQFEHSLLQQGLGGENKFRRGTLNGEIHIYCAGDPNTKEDDLDIKTRDIYIDSDRIWTSANILFSYGRTHGVGSELQIQFISNKYFNSPLHGNIGVFGESRIFDKLSLKNLQSLTFYLPKTEAKYEPGGYNDPNIPFTMQCSGAFVFSALNKCATFNENVILTRQVPDKQPETINCDLLNLQFVTNDKNKTDKIKDNSLYENSYTNKLPRSKSARQEKSASNSEWDLTLECIEAFGKTVTLIAPEYNVNVVTARLTARFLPELSFEIDSGSSNPSHILYEDYELHTNNVTYKTEKNLSLGSFECNSGGWFGGKLNSQQNSIRIRWEDKLEMAVNPNDNTEHVLAAKGNTSVEFIKKSQTEIKITSDSIYFWIKNTQNNTPVQNPSNKLSNIGSGLQIDRMKILDNVEITSTLLKGRLNELQLWIVQNPIQQNTSSGTVMSQQPQLNSNQRYEFLSTNTDNNQKPSVHFDVSGNLLRGNIIFKDNGYLLSQLSLNKDVKILVDNPSEDNSTQVTLTGNTIEIHDAMEPIASANLIGTPACVQYNNMAILGSAINVNFGTNRIWIDSPGEAKLQSGLSSIDNHDVNGISASMSNILPNDEQSADNTSKTVQNGQSNLDSTKPIISKIAWKQKMELEGDIIKCSGGVAIDGDNIYAQCDTLIVELCQKIDLQSIMTEPASFSQETQPLKIRNIILTDSVKLEYSTYEENRKTAQYTLCSNELKMKMLDQTFTAKGPGRAMAQLYAQPINFTKMLSKIAPTSNNAVPDTTTQLSDTKRLMHASADFQNEFTGSFNNTKPMTFIFSGRVEGIYAPINQIGDTYEIYDVTKKPDEEITYRCDTMEINTVPNSLEQNSSSLSLVTKNNSPNTPNFSHFSASGGVMLDSPMVSVNAAIATYQMKNQWLKIEGDGQLPAQFSYKKIRNGRFHSFSSSSINYNTNTGAITGEGIQNTTIFFEQPENSPKGNLLLR